MNKMNKDHLKLLCGELQPGTPLGDAARVDLLWSVHEITFTT
jgi:hypothetical protein